MPISLKKRYYNRADLKHKDSELLWMFTKWYYLFKPHGFSSNDYFSYELYYRNIDEAKTFVSSYFNKRIVKAARPHCTVEQTACLTNKVRFNQTFSDYVKRDYLHTKICTFSEFEMFLKKHTKFFGKLTNASWGRGAGIFEIKEDTEEVFKLFRSEGRLIEEIVQQHESIDEFNPDALNTIRISTWVTLENEVVITYAAIRFGRKGSIIDNYHGGGLQQQLISKQEY